jgi:hypothetical protein
MLYATRRLQHNSFFLGPEAHCNKQKGAGINPDTLAFVLISLGYKSEIKNQKS